MGRSSGVSLPCALPRYCEKPALCLLVFVVLFCSDRVVRIVSVVWVGNSQLCNILVLEPFEVLTPNNRRTAEVLQIMGPAAQWLFVIMNVFFSNIHCWICSSWGKYHQISMESVKAFCKSINHSNTLWCCKSINQTNPLIMFVRRMRRVYLERLHQPPWNW